MEDDIQNYLPTVIFRGTPCMLNLNPERENLYRKRTKNYPNYPFDLTHLTLSFALFPLRG